MSIEAKIQGKNPKRVLPQWKRQIRLQKSRMIAYVIASLVTGLIAISGFITSLIPLWLQIFCFIFLPIHIFGFFADRHIYLCRKADVEELEKLIDES